MPIVKDLSKLLQLIMQIGNNLIEKYRFGPTEWAMQKKGKE